MRIKKRPFHFFLLSILLTICIAYLLNNYPPSYTIVWKSFSVPLLSFVGLLFVGSIFSLCTYLFHSYVQGLLIALLVIGYLILRYINLTNIFFLLVLVALFGTLELFFLKKK